MSHASLAHLSRLPSPAMTRTDRSDDALQMRLLRHHTKNALQRIIAQVANTEIRATPEGNTLADDIERRIRLSARVSDALFGLTEQPGPMLARLTTLCESVVQLMGEPEQTIRTAVQVAGLCPERVIATVLQVAHELVTNAVKHGLHMRLTGEIEVTLETTRPASAMGGVTLAVRDNGWGPDKPGFGEGLEVLQLMADRHGGGIELVREFGWTVARLHIPGPL